MQCYKAHSSAVSSECNDSNFHGGGHPKNVGYMGGGGGGKGAKQKKNLKKKGVKDNLSNTTSCLPTPYKMNSP